VLIIFSSENLLQIEILFVQQLHCTYMLNGKCYSTYYKHYKVCGDPNPFFSFS